MNSIFLNTKNILSIILRNQPNIYRKIVKYRIYYFMGRFDINLYLFDCSVMVFLRIRLF